MAKFKPAKRRDKRPAAPAGGLPCVILVLIGFALLMAFFYFVMKYSTT